MFHSTLKNLFLIAMSFTVAAAPLFAQESCPDSGLAPSPTTATTPASNEKIESPDYCLTIETQIDQREFAHESFDFGPIVKATMQYFKAGDEAHKNAYEEMWYHDGKPIGMERFAALEIPADKKVAIKILQTACGTSSDETSASANLILRMVLDIRLNRDTITVVEVPSSSFQQVLMELQNRKANVMPPGVEAPAEARVQFKLQSQSTGMIQSVYFP